MYQDYHVETTSLLNFLEISSILNNFPDEIANIISQHTILSLKGYGCKCFYNTTGLFKPFNTHNMFSNREIGKEMDKDKEKKEHATFNQYFNIPSKFQTVSLNTCSEINWVLEVMKHSIAMPVFTNPEVVRHTVHIFSSWLLKSMCDHEHVIKGDTELDNTTQIPTCVRDNANDYAPIFIASLCNFFKNFVDSYPQFISTCASASTNQPNTADQKSEYLNLIKEVTTLIDIILSAVEHIATFSNNISYSTWDSLLYFCLNVGKLMLTCPSEPSHLTFTLADRISSMVFKIWLQACNKYFPRPSLWKTFNKLCQSWRHQEAFINQWNKINAAFTNRLLILITKNVSFPGLLEVDSATNDMIPKDLTEGCIKDCWYRFLTIIGNPVDICQSKLVLSFDFLDSKSKRRPSSQAAISHAISNLPSIFHRAMHGISNIVDAFLGFDQSGSGFIINDSIPPPVTQAPVPSTQKISTVNMDQASPPEIRRPNVSHQIFNIRKGKTGTANSRTPTMPFDSVTGSSMISDNGLSVESIPDPHPLRPEVNSMLRLFGNWLFEAAIVGVKQNIDNTAISVRASNIEPSKFNAGRAEACGTLCRLFTHCHRRNISMEYLTKFYIVVFYGLDIDPSTASSLVLSTILFNTIDILRIGLIGVNILVPRLFRGVEFVLTNEIEKPELLSKIQLRRAAIHHLLSMISLPSYFIGIDIKPLLPILNPEKIDSFYAIRKNMSSILSENIRNETDCINLHLLVGCLIAFLENLVKEETVDQNSGKSTESPQTEKIEVNNVVIYVPSAMSNQGSDIFNHALGMISINLVHKWKDDMNILQFALETLSDMSKMKFKSIDQKICKRAIRFLCEFIENQMNRKQKEHVRLLHNVIISAYYCLALWLVHHPNLLDDRDNLTSVLEISELGISGSKSKTHSSNGSENVRFKNSKSSSPTSKRVQVAAEYLLHCIMSELGAFPGLAGVEATSSLVNEELLLRNLSTTVGDENQFCFRYFGLDNDIILALLEKPMNKSSNLNDPLPSLSVIIRTSFGRYVWEMRLRQLPANIDSCDSNSNVQSPDCFSGNSVLTDKLFRSRPFNTGIFKQMIDCPDGDTSDVDVEPSYFPEILHRIEPFKVEASIPKLESLLDDSEKHRIESAIIENVKMINSVRSTSLKSRQCRSKNNITDLQCKKPIPVTEFQTARLLLYHMGYLTVNAFLYDNSGDVSTFQVEQEPRHTYNRGSDNPSETSVNISLAGKTNNNVLSPATSLLPTFYPLDSSTSNFFTAIDGLDRASSRSNDTCLIYYVKSGQTEPSEIIANYNDWPNLSTDFLAILLSLGWLVDVAEHPGWTGNIETSFQITHLSNGTGSISHSSSLKYRNKFVAPIANNSHTYNSNIPKEFQKLIQGPVPDGSNCILYWADSLKEVVFLMVSNENYSTSTNKIDFGIPTSDNAVTPTTTLAPGKEFGSVQSRLNPEKSQDSGMAVTLVWIEKWDDIESINIQLLVGKDRSAILVCPTPEGLFRVKVIRPPGKYFCAGPLFSGMILDIKNIGSLIRQTVININRRIRQDSESFYASHFQRSQKLQHIISEHRLQQSTSQLPDLFTSLFYPPICRTEPRF